MSSGPANMVAILQGLFGTGSRNSSSSSSQSNTWDSSQTTGATAQSQDVTELLRRVQQSLSATQGTQTGAQTGSQTTTNSGNTATTQNNTNQAAINRTVQQVMEGTNGLASIFGAQGAAGISGSSTAGLLTSDLMARVAGEVGRLTSSQTTTTGPSTSTTSSAQSTTAQSNTSSASTTADESLRQMSSLLTSLMASNRQSEGFAQTQSQSSSSGRSGGLCYITTAVAGEDSYELTVLRDFRDTWMKENAPSCVELYYATAPIITAYLQKTPQLYSWILTQFIHPAVDSIRAKHYKEAFAIYSAAVISLLALATQPQEA